MANVKVYNMSGAEVGSMELADSVFAVEVNTAVLHAAVRAYLLNQRQGTQSTLTRVQAEQDRVLPVLPSGHTAA